MNRPINVAATLCLVTTALAGQTSVPVTTERIEGMVRPIVVRGDFAGTILVAQNGRTLFANAWGKADIGRQVVNTVAQRYRLGAISQQFTAALVLDLSADGYLTTDDPLTRWLPGVRWAELVTVRDLLSHRSGLPRDFPVGPNGEELLTTDSDRYAWLSSITPPGGRQYRFSNVGYWLLAQVAARAGGEPFEGLLRTRIFEPNGLRSLEFEDGAHPIVDLPNGYEPEGMTDIVVRTPTPLGGRLGASGLVASASDLATWTNALHAGRIVPRPLADALVDGRWGFDSTDRAGKHVIGRDGEGQGFVASVDWYREGNITLIILGDLRTGARSRLRDAIPAALFGLPIPDLGVPPMGQVPPAAWLVDYTGSFRGSDGRMVTVQQRGTTLVIARPGEFSGDVYPIEPGVFFQRLSYARIEFTRDRNGKVDGLRWVQDGITLTLARQ